MLLFALTGHFDAMIQPRAQAGKALSTNWPKTCVKLPATSQFQNRCLKSGSIAAALTVSFPFSCHSDQAGLSELPPLVEMSRFVARVDFGIGSERHLMKRILAIISLIALFSGLPAAAQDRVTLGWGRLFSNDAIGDGHDRWRTGSYQISLLRGISFNGSLPKTPGDLLEFRVSSQIIAPTHLNRTSVKDRRYVGLISLGLHTDFDWRGYEVSLGGDLFVVGPQTRVSDFQRWVHRMMNLPNPKAMSRQIGNGVYPNVLVELGRQTRFAPDVTLRPFVEAQVGVENFVRVGGDLVIGTFGQDAFMARETVTGHRYRVVRTTQSQGYSFVFGGDYTRVASSVFLPKGEAAVRSAYRKRLRAGLQWQGDDASLFYGISYLSREFKAQSEGQIVGVLNLNLTF